MRLGVYTDYTYHRAGDEVHAERAFAVFIARLAPHFSRLAVIGRLDPEPARAGYALGKQVDFIPLPYYRSLARPAQALRTIGRATWRFWRALGELDCVWLLGPHGFVIPFAMLAALRRKRVVLGVRQDLIPYVRARHPGRRGLLIMATLLEGVFRALARRWPVVVVGPDLARGYGAAPELLEIVVSMVERDDVVDPASVASGSPAAPLTVLSVGRLDTEKNPLLLADVLARLNADGPRWRMVICGEGPLRDALDERLHALGVGESAEIRGYVPLDQGLRELYRDSSAFLHVSWTEGMPQVILEAFAAALPTVATDVGGVRGSVGHAVDLIPPGDADAAASALEAIAGDPALRRRLVEAGHEHVCAHTIESESSRVASFIRGANGAG